MNRMSRLASIATVLALSLVSIAAAPPRVTAETPPTALTADSVQALPIQHAFPGFPAFTSATRIVADSLGAELTTRIVAQGDTVQRPSLRPSTRSRLRVDTTATAAASDSTTRHRTPITPRQLILTLAGFAIMGATLQTAASDKDLNAARDDTRANMNKFGQDTFYVHRNRSGTVAPGIAIATTTTRLKTVNATTFIAGGIPKALAATDPVWTLTGAVLAVGMNRKYRLLHTGAAASVQASTDSATAAGCTFAAQPADGSAILGMITVTTDASHTFTPDTTLLGATGITTAIIDGSDGSEFTGRILTP